MCERRTFEVFANFAADPPLRMSEMAKVEKCKY